MTQPAAARLGAYVASLAGRDLGQDVLDKAAVCLVDAVGLGMAASREPATRAFLRVIRALPAGQQGDGTARLWPTGGRAALSEAVAVNAFAVHARFQDDCDMASWSHPGSLVVPAALTAAEASGASLDRVLRAVVAGYTVINWLGGGGVYGHAMVERGFRTSPTLGPVGAAAAAGVVLGLTADQAAHALSCAAAVAGGVIDTVQAGSSDFRWQNATAAWQGLGAALLAREGLDGSPGIFESPAGFLAGFAGLGQPIGVPGEPSPEAILTTWAKPFPALGDNVAVIAAALAIHRHGAVDPRAVARIRVHQNAQFASYPGTSYRGPFTRPAQAIASTAYGVASTLVHGPLRYDRYLNALHDPEVEALIARTEIVGEEDFGFLDGLVTVEETGGDTGGRTRSGRAADLPDTMFYRDPAAAVTVLEELCAETALDAAPAVAAADELFDRTRTRRLGDVEAGAFCDAILAAVRADLTEKGAA